MFRFIGLFLGTLVRFLRARRSLLLENLALRQQLAVLKRLHPQPRLDLLDKLFWVAVRRFWSGWQQSLIVVAPETVVRWHRAGFRLTELALHNLRRCSSVEQQRPARVSKCVNTTPARLLKKFMKGHGVHACGVPVRFTR
jgi:hypothetical protein